MAVNRIKKWIIVLQLVWTHSTRLTPNAVEEILKIKARYKNKQMRHYATTINAFILLSETENTVNIF